MVVSLRSKGLACVNKSHCLDLKLHVVALATEVGVWSSNAMVEYLSDALQKALDLVFSFLLSVFHLSWSSWLSILVVLVVSAWPHGRCTWPCRRIVSFDIRCIP